MNRRHRASSLLHLFAGALTAAACMPAAAIDPLSQPPAERLRLYEERLADWPQLAHYRESNAQIGAPAPGEARVVFLGDSITEGWPRRAGGFFPGMPYVNRGIFGQTTPQILLRFRADVIALKPRAVVILAGSNDLAGKTGTSSLAMIEDNLASMTELAQANGIKVVLASLLPDQSLCTAQELDLSRLLRRAGRCARRTEEGAVRRRPASERGRVCADDAAGTARDRIGVGALSLLKTLASSRAKIVGARRLVDHALPCARRADGRKFQGRYSGNIFKPFSSRGTATPKNRTSSIMPARTCLSLSHMRFAIGFPRCSTSTPPFSSAPSPR